MYWESIPRKYLYREETWYFFSYIFVKAVESSNNYISSSWDKLNIETECSMTSCYCPIFTNSAAIWKISICGILINSFAWFGFLSTLYQKLLCLNIANKGLWHMPVAFSVHWCFTLWYVIKVAYPLWKEGKLHCIDYGKRMYV